MTDEMTDARLAEIREGLTEFDKRRLETSMSGGVDTPGRVTYHFGPSPDGLPRYSIIGMLPEIATELVAEVERLRGEVQRLESSKLLAASMMAESCCEDEVERLRGRNIDLAMRLDMAVHEMEGHVAPERDRLREQVETLQAERDAMTSEEGPTP